MEYTLKYMYITSLRHPVKSLKFSWDLKSNQTKNGGKSLKAANFETGCNYTMTQDYEPLPESMIKRIIRL